MKYTYIHTYRYFYTATTTSKYHSYNQLQPQLPTTTLTTNHNSQPQPPLSATTHYQMSAAISGAPSRLQVLQLYKQLLRLSSQVRLSDTTFVTQRVKAEFRGNISLEDETDIAKCYQRGRAMQAMNTIR